MSKLTIKDVAKEAGVSIATASYVLNNKPGKVSTETRERVLGVAKRLGYRLHPVASQIRGASRNLMVLLPGQPLDPDLKGILIDYPFFNELMAGIEHAAVDAGWYPTLNRIESHDDVRQLINGPTPAGLLVLGKHTDSTLEALEDLSAPVVVIDDRDYFSRHPLSHLYDFSIDDVSLGLIATQHLLSQGHRNIILLFGHLDKSSVHRDRMMGVQRAFSQQNLNIDPNWLIETDVTLKGINNIQTELDRLLNQGATAILCMADILSIGSYNWLVRKGISVPQQISIIGIDNLNILNYLPIRLATVGQDVYGRGYQAVNIINGKQPELPQISLFSGESVMPVSN